MNRDDRKNKLIHFKLTHRLYIMPSRAFLMKLSNNKLCNKCSTASVGDYRHMFWECPHIMELWTYIVKVLSRFLLDILPLSPGLLLLADDSGVAH